MFLLFNVTLLQKTPKGLKKIVFPCNLIIAYTKLILLQLILSYKKENLKIKNISHKSQSKTYLKINNW